MIPTVIKSTMAAEPLDAPMRSTGGPENLVSVMTTTGGCDEVGIRVLEEVDSISLLLLGLSMEAVVGIVPTDEGRKLVEGET